MTTDVTLAFLDLAGAHLFLFFIISDIVGGTFSSLWRRRGGRCTNTRTTPMGGTSPSSFGDEGGEMQRHADDAHWCYVYIFPSLLRGG